MKRLQFGFSRSLFCVAAIVLAACRGEESYARFEMRKPEIPLPSGSRKPHPDPSCSITETCARQPDDEDEGDASYATELLLTAGCEENPQIMAVANLHDTPSGCEHLTLTPLMRPDQDSELFVVPAAISWTVSDASVLHLPCVDHDDLSECWPFAHADIFDTGEEQEPVALVTVCAANDCPNPPPDDCIDALCIELPVVSVVNVEGSWIFHGAMFHDELPATIFQDGRTFEDVSNSIEKGVIEKKNVAFEVGDYAYTGVIFPERDMMSGDVHDILSLTKIGEWWAIRSL